MIISAVSQDIKRNTTFTLIVRLLHIFLFEKVSQVLVANSEDILVGQLGHLRVVIKLRSNNFSKVRLEWVYVAYWIHILFKK